MNKFLYVALCLVLPWGVAGLAIEAGVDCGSRLSMNDALVAFSSNEGVFELQGRNSYCYKCAWSHVAEPGSCR